MSAQPEIHPEDPHDAAEDALYQCKGDRMKAVKLLRKWADNDTVLRNALLQLADLDQIIWDLVRFKVRRIRGEIRQPSGESKARWTPYFMTLRNGTPLGEATREDLIDAMEWEAQLERAAKRNHHFYRRIVEKLKPGQKVKERFTETDLQRLLASDDKVVI